MERSVTNLGQSAGVFTAGQFACAPPKLPNKNWHDLPAVELECRWVDDLDELVSLLPSWKRLGECCLCPNVFYEPQLFIPAWKHLRQGNVRVAVVQASERAQPGAPKVLCGMLPLEISRTTFGLPLRSAKLWQHVHCFLTTPLIRSDVARETWSKLVQFLAGDEGRISILNLPCVSAEGPFQHALVDYLRAAGLAWQQRDIFRRALFVRNSNDEAFFDEWPRKRRHELNRLERRLAESGMLAIEEFHVGDDAEQFADQFLALEAMGWKGLAGTAMGNTEAHLQFLKEAMIELASENRLMGLTMRLDGNPIAMKANFLTHSGGFAFKICFHPAWAKFSPGAILEKINIAKLHETERVQWMDSCAIPDHTMINTLWPERRMLQSLSIATDRMGSRTVVSALPMLTHARDSVKSFGANWLSHLSSRLSRKSAKSLH